MDNNREQNAQSKGFTIVELLIATVVFSVILLVCTTAILQIGRLYYKGITSTRTQETARQIIDELSRSIQFGGGSIDPVTPVPAGTPNSFYFCIDAKRYTFLKGRQLKDAPVGPNQTKNALVVDDCMAPKHTSLATGFTPPPGGGYTPPRELLGVNMRLAKLDIQNSPLGSNLWKIDIRIVYGDDDVLNASKDNCGSFRSGTQFCAVSELSTVVKRRLGS